MLRIGFLYCLLMPRSIVASDSFDIRLDGWTARIDPKTLSVSVSRKQEPPTMLIPGAFPESPVRNFVSKAGQVTWSLPDRKLTMVIQSKGSRLHVRFTSQAEQFLHWPTMTPNNLSALIIPDGGGLYIPVSDPFWLRLIGQDYCKTLSGGLSMPFLGFETPIGNFVMIVPTDLRSELCLHSKDGQLYPVIGHTFLARDKLPDYEVIITPTVASPIGPALAFRNWLQENHLHVSLQDKIRRNPEVEKLIGATHMYLWGDGRTAKALQSIRNSGVDRAVMSYDQDPRSDPNLLTKEQIALAKKLGYLVGPYDAATNIQPPQKADAINSVFDDVLYQTGCIIKKNGKKKTGFAGRGCELSSEALRTYKRPFIQERLQNHKNQGVNSYYLDCDAFGEFFDDYSVQHPMTQAQDRENRAHRMRTITHDYGLVLGSEGGTAWATQFVDFLHGAHDSLFDEMLWPIMRDKKTFGGWWPPEAMGIFYKPISVSDDFVLARYSSKYRIPLFQTVFHDSVVSTERWELSLPKMPTIAQKRALLWQLYGIAPIWNVHQKMLKRHAAYMADHHRFFSAVHQATAFLPISKFEWIGADKQMQRIYFGNDVRMTANFSPHEREQIPPNCVEAHWIQNKKSLQYCPKSIKQ